MTANPLYTPHHPKWYRRPVSVWWWLERWCYARFVLRELSSIFVAFAVCLYLWELRALLNGAESHARFSEKMRSPLMLSINAMTLAALVFHSVTWFHLAPRATVLRVRGKKVPDGILIGFSYFLWIAASCAIAWILLRG